MHEETDKSQKQYRNAIKGEFPSDAESGRVGPGAKQVFRLLEWNVDGELLGHGEDVAKRSRYRQVATIAVALTYVPLGIGYL